MRLPMTRGEDSREAPGAEDREAACSNQLQAPQEERTYLNKERAVLLARSYGYTPAQINSWRLGQSELEVEARQAATSEKTGKDKLNQLTGQARLQSLHNQFQAYYEELTREREELERDKSAMANLGKEHNSLKGDCRFLFNANEGKKTWARMKGNFKFLFTANNGMKTWAKETITRLMTKLSCAKEELVALQEKLYEVEKEKEQVVGERTSLLEMDTALSAQVSDSLANIHKLQCREVELGREMALLRGFMEAWRRTRPRGSCKARRRGPCAVRKRNK